MTVVSDIAASTNDEADRNLALLAYGLLFFAIFFAGAPALIAVAIAYTRRGRAGRLVRSHHSYQIFTFWVAFALTVLAALSGLAAVISLLGQIIASATRISGPTRETFTFTLPYFGSAVAAFATAALALGVFSGLWLMGMSIYGLARLASHRSIGQTAP